MPQARRRTFALTFAGVLALAAWWLVAHTGERGAPGAVSQLRVDALAPATNPELETPGAAAARRSNSEHAEPANAATEPHGRVAFLGAVDARPIGDTPWTLTSAGPDAARVRVDVRGDEHGFTDAPLGTWNVASGDESLVAPREPLLVDSTTTAIVWVLRRGTLSFRLSTPAGAPIEAVHAHWLPYHAPDQDWAATLEAAERARALEFVQRSDDAGRVSFANAPIDAGVAVFLHPRFQRRVYWVTGAQPDPVELTLQPAASAPVRVAFVRCGDRTPVTGVRVRPNAGYVLATDEGTPGSVEIPSGVGPHEPLTVEAPGIFRAAFQLSDAAAGTIELHEVSLVHVRAVAAASVECDVALHVDATCPRGSSACATPLFEPVRTLRSGVRSTIPCPLGTALAVRAFAENGAVAETSLALDQREHTLELALRVAEPALELEVFDAHGTRLTNAWAAAFHAPDFRARATADGAGRLRVPVRDGVSTLEVGAAGCAVERFTRAPGDEAVSGAGRIVLEREHAFRLGIVYPDGTPAPGIAVRVRPARALPAPAGASSLPASWTRAPRRALVRVTDAAGQARFDGFAPGRCEVECSLAGILRSNESDETLAFPPRELTLEPDAHDYEIVIAGARQVGLRVREASTGLAVERFRLSACGGAMELEVEGDTWRGWVPGDCASLGVSVAGVGRTTVALDASRAPATLVARVQPDVLTTVVVGGAEGAELDGTAEFNVFRARNGGLQLVDSVQVPMAHGRASFCLPIDGEFAIALASVGGAEFGARCRPVALPWTSGGTLEFHLE